MSNIAYISHNCTCAPIESVYIFHISANDRQACKRLGFVHTLGAIMTQICIKNHFHAVVAFLY
jgi:hypothetical protein